MVAINAGSPQFAGDSATMDLPGGKIQPGHPLFGIVWVNPERMSGTPCFAGTRVPVRSLFDHLEGGDSLDLFLSDFPPVTRPQAIAVLENGYDRLISEVTGL